MAYCGERLALWLVGSPPDQAADWVQDLAGYYCTDCVVIYCRARHFVLSVSVSTQVYKGMPANLMLRVMLGGNPVQ